MDFLGGDWVQHVLANYSYAAIFVVVMLESAGVPLAGETILVSAAAYAGHEHSLDIRYVIAAAAGGAIFGDNVGFWVGRKYGTSLLSKWGHLIGLDERKRKLGQYLFARHGGKIVFFGRFIALLRALAAVLAGANGLSPLRFFPFNAARGNCLGDGVWIGRIRAWRKHSSNCRTLWMGVAHCGDCFCCCPLALLQKT